MVSVCNNYKLRALNLSLNKCYKQLPNDRGGTYDERIGGHLADV